MCCDKDPYFSLSFDSGFLDECLQLSQTPAIILDPLSGFIQYQDKTARFLGLLFPGRDILKARTLESHWETRLRLRKIELRLGASEGRRGSNRWTAGIPSSTRSSTKRAAVFARYDLPDPK